MMTNQIVYQAMNGVVDKVCYPSANRIMNVAVNRAVKSFVLRNIHVPMNGIVDGALYRALLRARSANSTHPGLEHYLAAVPE